VFKFINLATFVEEENEIEHEVDEISDCISSVLTLNTMR